ncbi:MAG: DNA polymerase III subunit gamma/tau [Deltaproteobacteria bacterium]|nr:DNA polymerase III subunit gamma/tau [Deltaproteobacteria bacterium]
MKLALARKYRPQDFTQVIGQDAIVQTLKNALELNKLHHAYLFSGVRGVGKTSMARILAKSINCEKGPTITPCQECSNCQDITLSKSLDVLEIDGASNNLVDDVRDLREQIKFLPSEGRYKIVIIDEVHMLSQSAFNALLKTLEEPPEHVIFIFATTESHKIPVTILSRCQKYDFRKLTTQALFTHLKNIAQQEKLKIEDAALHLVASCAQGSVRDSLSLLDQIASLSQDSISEEQVRNTLGLADRILVLEASQALVQANSEQALAVLQQVDERGFDLKLFAESILQNLRHLILMQSTGQAPDDLSPSEKDSLLALKENSDLSLLIAQYETLYTCLNQLQNRDFQKTNLEIAFVKLCHVGSLMGLADLVQTIKSRAGKQTRPSTSTQTATSPAKAPQTPVRSAPSKASNVQASTGTAPQTENNQQDASSWYEFVKWVTKEKPPLGTLLKDAKPISFSKDQVQVGFGEKTSSKDIVIERVSQVEELLAKYSGNAPRFLIKSETPEKKKPLA